MSGRSGLHSWTSNSYKHASASSGYPVANSEDMWDDEPSSSVTQLTQVFHNQSLKNTPGNDWDAWDGNYIPKTVNVYENSNKAGNFGGFDCQRDGVRQSSASGQCPDVFGQRNESLRSSDDTAPFETKISSRQVGLVIGKGGSRIKELQASSGAKINVRRNDVDANGMVLVILEGDEASRSNAKRMIDELLENDSYSPNAGRMDNLQNQQMSKRFGDSGGFHDKTELTVASNMLGAVIGRGGQKIREIEGSTQTKIKIGDNRYGVTVEITINGSEDGRQQAKLLIEDAIRAESETDYMPKSERPDFGGNFTSNEQKLASGSTELQVPTHQLGSIIGRAGQIIKLLSDKTETKIRIADDRSGATVGITIYGSESGRLQAKSMIEDIVQPASETNYPSNSEGSTFNGSHTTNQHRSGFGAFDNNEVSDRSNSRQTSERSGFGDFHTGSRQRSGFGNFDDSEPTERSFGNSGRSSFGNSVPRRGFAGASAVIDWDHVKELSQKHEEEKWKEYPPIKKNFYIEDAGVANMEPEEVAAIREENNHILVSCEEISDATIPNPVQTFEEGFLHYPEILSELKRAGFTKPSPIQMQGWPIALQGLDLIGIAQTGTGKTLAFLLPAFIHIEGQPVPRGKRGGPNVLVLSPTRELALQVTKIGFVWLHLYRFFVSTQHCQNYISLCVFSFFSICVNIALKTFIRLYLYTHYITGSSSSRLTVADYRTCLANIYLY